MDVVFFVIGAITGVVFLMIFFALAHVVAQKLTEDYLDKIDEEEGDNESE